MMNKFKLNSAVFLAIAFISFSYIRADTAQAADKWIPPTLQISIPTIKNFSAPTQCGTAPNGQPVYCVPWIGEYLAGIYKYAIGIIGIVAAIALMIGGIRWLTAGGNPSGVKDAQSWITGAVTGLIIGLASYLILNQINPNLVQFQPIKVVMVSQAPITSSTSSQYINCKPQIETQCSSGYVSTGNISDCSEVMGNYVGEGMDSTKYQTCCCQVKATAGCNWKDKCDSSLEDSADYSKCGTYWSGPNTCCCSKTSQVSCKNCNSMFQGNCSQSNMTAFGNQYATQASAICNAESTNGTDIYNCGKAVKSQNVKECACSAGAFQVRIPSHKNLFSQNCTNGFVGTTCQIANQTAHDACVDEVANLQTNIAAAAKIFQAANNKWSPWGVYNDPNKCGGCF